MTFTESMMLVALGALLALIVVIIFARSFWEMAMFVMRWRKRNQVPVKVMNLEADVSQLRAENAMMTAKMETSIAEMRDKLTTQIAEASRLRNRVMEMTNEIATKDREIADRDKALLRMSSKLEELGKGEPQRETPAVVHIEEPRPESAVQKVLAEVASFTASEETAPAAADDIKHRKVVTLTRSGGLSAITQRLKAMQSHT